MACMRSEVSHGDLAAIFSWVTKTFATCGWPSMQEDTLYRSQMKQVAYEAWMVCGHRISLNMPGIDYGSA